MVLKWLGIDNFLLTQYNRLERNQEREEGVSNMEYLKNVVLKVCVTRCNPYKVLLCLRMQCTQFLHNEGEERRGLIPIIEKLLLLSPQEVKYLEDTIIRGMYCTAIACNAAWMTTALCVFSYR